jgi:hypothetical protein
MELGGSEKRIQALFSELSLEDESTVPQFGHVWSCAQAVKVTEVRNLGRPVAVLLSLIVTAAAGSFAVWSWYRLTAPQTLEIANRPQEKAVEAPLKPEPVKVVAVPQREKVRPKRQLNTARQRQTDRRIATEAALLSNWQSPTQRYVESPTGLVLTSLPQLNQSVKDLESFLPKN